MGKWVPSPRQPRAAALGTGAAVLVLAGAVAPAFHATGPPPGHTGGFGEPTCLECHFGDPLNAYGGSVRIEGLPEAYVAGETYPLTVVLRMDDTAIAGFQLAARFSEGVRQGEAAGTLRPVDTRVTVTPSEGGQPYVHQTPPGSVVSDGSGASWSVVWVAPEEQTPVVFHVAANSGNGDNSPLGDLIYTAEVRVGGR